jgi:hypothetical protein
VWSLQYLMFESLGVFRIPSAIEGLMSMGSCTRIAIEGSRKTRKFQGKDF